MAALTISLHDAARVDALARDCRIDPQILRRFRNAFYKKGLDSGRALGELPQSARERFAAAVEFHSLEMETARDSRIDGATKILWRAADRARLETVILRAASGRTTLCLSTQAGCAAACVFCATGKLGLSRNLSAAEILDQVAQASARARMEKRAVRNLVFMGMGEPFHNEENLHAALETLQSPRGFHFDGGRLLVSTVGIPAAMVRCARRFPRVRLALSLHSARPGTRERLVPLARKHSLEELREAAREAAATQGRPVMIEYLMLRGVNDGPDDLAALLDWVKDIPVHLNLIPYNPVDGGDGLEGTPPAERERFADALRESGLKVTTRRSLGADIEAACGQLAGSVERD